MSHVPVLCVDDEPNVLRGLALHMRRHFDVTTTADPADALARLRDAPTPFAVVLSDYRMPGMDGLTLLTAAAEVAPDTTRVLLTGHADLSVAIGGINDAHLYQLLTKPCPPQRLLGTMRAAAEHHRLIRAERELLEQTVRGCVKTLTSVLSMAQPEAFGRAQRAQALVAELAEAEGLATRWPAEVAALLSQLGAVALPARTVTRMYRGEQLGEDEQRMVDRLPKVVEDLLAPIPRLEPVRDVLHCLGRRYDRHDELPWGARALRIALDYDALESTGLDVDLALQTLWSRSGLYDPGLLKTFAGLRGASQREANVQELGLWQVASGMTFLTDVRLANGATLIARGHVATPGLIERVKNLPPEVANLPVRVAFEAVATASA